MTTSKEVLDIARAHLGYVEGENNANQFGEWYGMNNVPWCAEFVSKVFFDAGNPLPASTDKGFASCYYGAQWFKSLGTWLAADQVPEPGYVVFYNWGQGIKHVGIVEKANGVRDIYAIEGNTDGGGSRTGGQVMRQHRTTRLIAGYGIVAYEVPQPAASGHPLLRRGMNGPAVQWWQGLLNSYAGGKLQADGNFGRATFNKTVEFQRYCKLKADGIVGEKTWATMDYAAGK